MICPDTSSECDNLGCRHGGCMGRRPQLPLFREQALPKMLEKAAETTHSRSSATSLLSEPTPSS